MQPAASLAFWWWGFASLTVQHLGDKTNCGLGEKAEIERRIESASQVLQEKGMSQASHDNLAGQPLLSCIEFI